MKLHLAVILTLIFSFSILGQTVSLTAEQSKIVENLLNLNRQVVQLYGEKKFDEALVIGKNIFDIATKENLTSDVRVLPAITNLAEVYFAKGKESEAIMVYQTALSGYEKIGNTHKPELEKVMSRTAAIYASKKDFKDAEALYLKLKSLIDVVHGEKSRQAANVYIELGNIYNLQKKNDEADAHYLKAVLINDSVLVDIDPEKREDLNIYKCFIYHREYQKNNLKDALEAFKDLDKKRNIPHDYNQSQGIINGRAVNLVIPKYPDKAKQKRTGGFAVIKVDLDEQGNVTKATPYCGFLDFVEAVEQAALKSKFSPTLRNGIPIRVTGEIVYKFM